MSHQGIDSALAIKLAGVSVEHHMVAPGLIDPDLKAVKEHHHQPTLAITPMSLLCNVFER